MDDPYSQRPYEEADKLFMKLSKTLSSIYDNVSENPTISTLSAYSPTTTFTLFPHLPTELRLEIWKLSLPSRLIVPKRHGSSFAPGPSAISQVCQEARYVALKHGLPVSFDIDTRRGGSGWYNPTQDVVQWVPNVRNIPFENAPHRICPTPLWPSVPSITAIFQSSQDILRYGHRIWDFRDINVMCRDGYEVPTSLWKPETITSVFGAESVVLINILEEDQVVKIMRALCRDPRALPCARALLECVRHHKSAYGNTFNEFYHEWISMHLPTAPPALFALEPDNGEGMAEFGEWMERIFKTFPKIRPVFMMHIRHDGRIKVNTRETDRALPAVQWADGVWKAAAHSAPGLEGDH